jgi:hypothetical protein|tara:strand:+ start:172 stop:306 length:135 start_codon:yes stop_codon:yes gene_type:complete
MFSITMLSDKKVVAIKVGNPKVDSVIFNVLSDPPQLKHFSANEL